MKKEPVKQILVLALALCKIPLNLIDYITIMAQR